MPVGHWRLDANHMALWHMETISRAQVRIKSWSEEEEKLLKVDRSSQMEFKAYQTARIREVYSGFLFQHKAKLSTAKQCLLSIVGMKSLLSQRLFRF